MPELQVNASSGEMVALVILGSMNPPLHHPQWYQFIGELTEAETTESLGREFLILPQLAQFDAGSFQVTCDPQRWQITTSDAGAVDRILRVATSVFDKRLVETPVSAVGINVHIHTATMVNVAVAINRMISRLPFGFTADPNGSGKVSFLESRPKTEISENARLRWEIEPSARGHTLAYVGASLELRLSATPGLSRFSLHELVAPKLPVLQAEARAKTTEIVEAINREGRA